MKKQPKITKGFSSTICKCITVKELIAELQGLEHQDWEVWEYNHKHKDFTHMYLLDGIKEAKDYTTQKPLGFYSL